MSKDKARQAVLSEFDSWAKKHPNDASHNGRLSLLPIPTDRQVGPSRLPCGWQQVANRSRLASRSVARLAATESSARFAAVLLLRHLAIVEFSENRDRLFGPVEPINTNAVVGVGVFRDLEYIGRSVVMKFHGQRIRRKDVVSGVTAPLSGDVFIRRRVGHVCG